MIRHIVLALTLIVGVAGCATTPDTMVAATPWGIGGVYSFRARPVQDERDRSADADLHRRLWSDAAEDPVVVASR